MTSSISTDDATIQSESSAASARLSDTMAGVNRGGAGAAVDPRLAAAAEDARDRNRRAAARNDDGIERTKRDSAGKTDIDKGGAAGIGGVGSAILGALGAGAAPLAQAGQQAAAAPMAQMPMMPQIPAATAGQSLPASLSSPAAAALVRALLGGDSSVVGSRGLTVPGGGGSGTVGPAGTGSNAYEQRILNLARQVAAARLPYAWGGGTLNGPSQGTRDGGAADMAGDYAKSGFDCSSLARFLVYQASGVEIPRTSQDQYGAGMVVSPADARPGDLLFPSSAGVPPDHVVVYVGGGKVLEAAYSGTTIGFADVRPGTFKRYVAAG